MKRTLFPIMATLGLVGTVAEAAEVKLSGYGRFGLGYLENRSDDPDVNNTIIVSRFRLNLDGIAETDGGVRFESRVRVQADESQSTGDAGEAGFNGARFSVLYEGLRLDVGNIGGAISNMSNRSGFEPGLESFVGQSSGIDYEYLGYTSTGAGANAVQFQYEINDLEFRVSYDQNTTDNDNDAGSGADQWDVGAQYTYNNITASFAYGETDGATDDVSPSLAILTLRADFDQFSGTLLLAKDSDTPLNSLGEETDGTAYGVSMNYKASDATSIYAAYGDGSAKGDTQEFGIGAIHNLGGGTTLRGGIGSLKEGSADSQLRADIGVRFNF
ncbi:MAG: porin [Marinibacterium sp.]|nr:porin [Marinibacterium sp.]